MALSIAFILDRASKSTAVAVTFTALWTWDEKTPAQHDAMRIGVEAAEALAVTFEAAMLQARADYDNRLDQYHSWTSVGLSLAKVLARNDPGKLATLSTLTAEGRSRRAIREEGERWLAWWLKFDPAWVPMPGLTTAAFTALKVQIEGVDNPGGASTPGLADLYDTAHAAWREKAEIRNGLARALEDVNEAWYEAATRVFAEGTPQGDLIRGQVPTTYDPITPPLPPPIPVPGAPQNVGAQSGTSGSGEGTFTFDERPVEEAVIEYRVYDGAGDMLLATVAGSPVPISGLPPGEPFFRSVSAVNAGGEGPRSEVASGTAG